MEKRKFLPLIGILLFVSILVNIDLNVIIGLFARIRLEYVFLSLSLLIPAILLRAVKWKIIIKSYETKFSLMSAAKAWLIGFFLGIITPGRIGDLSRAYYLRREGNINMGSSLTTVIADRIVDIGMLFFLASVGLVMIATVFSKAWEILFYIIFLFIIFLLGLSAFSKKSFTRFVLKPLSKRVTPAKYQADLSRVFHDFYHGIDLISKYNIAITVFVAFVAWIVVILQYYLFSLALNIELPFLFFFAIVPAVALLDALPVSFSGIGTREAALVFFFSLNGASAETAVSLSLLIFIMIYLVNGFVGMLLWIRDPIKIK